MVIDTGKTEISNSSQASEQTNISSDIDNMVVLLYSNRMLVGTSQTPRVRFGSFIVQGDSLGLEIISSNQDIIT